ncbi:MAG: hypothetical protein Q9164_002279 [Protoblastenia rupestris]
MTDQSKSPFSFVQPTAPGTSGTSLFGQTSTTSAPPSGGLFGSSSNPPATSGGGLFGSTSTSNSGGSGLFGSSTATSQPSSTFGSGGGTTSGGNNIFGGGNKPASSGFSFPPASNSNASGGGLFGSTPTSSQGAQGGMAVPSENPFSFATPNKPSESTSGQTPKPNMFGGQTNTGGGSLFNLGSNTSQAGTTTPTSKPTSSLFGNSTTPAGPPPTNSVGAGSANPFNLAKPQSQSESLFGKPTTSSAAPSLFSNVSQPTSNPLPSAPTTSAAPASLFDTSSKASSDAFGNKGGAQQAGGLFANLNNPQDSGADKKSNPFHLGGHPPASTSTAPSTSGPLFGGTSTAPSFSFAKTSAPAFSAPTVSSPSTATSGFSFLSQPTATSGTTAPTATPSSSTLFNISKPQDNAPTTAAPSSSAPAPTSSLFSNLGKSAPPPVATTQPPNQDASKLSTVDSKQPTNLTASTTGPPPPAQSRLKNKSMDEIITRWATDLSKYQKEFQAQAEKVAQWDRMLVDNSEKIQKLYGQTLEAERATTEVERQLSSVENDQAELEAWLNHYEGEVDQMIKNQGVGEGTAGPDKEREHTYQLASRLSEKLDEMGKDLTSMIEEINDASSNLSKNSKQDDPLSQVVRVLNSHLTQLQQIDQGAAALTLKVQAAQKAARASGSISGANGSVGGGLSGPSSEAADAFWRSYMGRR